jgi:hypothetical protein
MIRQYPDSEDWEKKKVLKTMKPCGRKPDDRYYDFFGEGTAGSMPQGLNMETPRK